MRKRIELATTSNITTTYAGEDSGRFTRAALLSADSLNNGAVTALDNVKYKTVLHKLDLANLVQNDSCDFTDSSSVTLAERILEVERFKVNVKLCKDNYRNTFHSQQMGASAHDDLPRSFADFLVQSVVDGVAAQHETVLWSGANANAGEYDGFETLMTNQPTQPAGFEIAAVGGGVNSSNVVAEIQKVIDAASTAVYSAPGFAVRIGSGIARNYIAAQAALGYRDLYHAGVTELSFQGVPLIVCPGMSANTMIATYQDNLFFGTNVFNDWNECRVLDQAMIDGSDNVHIVMKYAAGVQIANPEDIVSYGITNAGN